MKQHLPAAIYAVVAALTAFNVPAAEAPPKPQLTLRLTDEGVAIEAGSMGQFTLQYPVLVGERWDQIRRPIEKHVTGMTATIRYGDTGHIDVTLEPAGGAVTLTPAGLPADVKSLRMEMLIDFAYANGGVWKVGNGTGTSFPAEKPAKPHLYQGNADLFTLKDAQGLALVIKVPPYSYQELTDNREWNWKTFHWQFAAPYAAEAGPLSVKISSACATAEAKPLVDRFGQTTRMDFPDKLKSEAELKADIPAEADYLASLHPPAGDTFGGLPGSREKLGLKQTGFFHVEKNDERWLLVDPEGNVFFHLGVCALGPSDDYTYFKGREQIFEWLPAHDGAFSTAFHPDPYWNPNVLSFHLVNLIRKLGQPYAPADYTARMIERVRKWGFNSAGAFGSGDAGARRQASFPAVAHLPLATWEGFPEIPGAHGVFDPFSNKLRERCDQNFAKLIAPAAHDPLIIGYFLNNEPLYEDIPRAVAALDNQHPCKRRLVQMLEEEYKTIDAFNMAWSTAFTSFSDVAAHGLPVKTRAAADDMQHFTGLFLDAYFRIVTQTFHKYDQHHLLIGNRLQSGTINNEQLCRISGKYLDVLSFNYYTYGLDTNFLHRIHQWIRDRPMILSEFYYSSPKDSGLPGGAKDVSSQRERGRAYRNYVEQAAALGYVIGIEWFTLMDQAVSGRWFDKYNGENANTGLIAVSDRPWKAMLTEMMQSNYEIYKVLFGGRPPYHFDDPRFASGGAGRKVAKISRAIGPIAVNGLTANWPGTPAETIPANRLVQGANAGGLEASFKLCWDDTNLYLLAHVADATPMNNANKGDMLWSGDAVELFIGHEQIEQGGALRFSDQQILLGAGPLGNRDQWHFCRAAEQPQCEMKVVPDVDGKGYTLETAIPFHALGFAPQEGQPILFDLAVDDSTDGKTRERQIVWNGTARNSGDRSAWGHAIFAR